MDSTSTDFFSLTPKETSRRFAPVGVKVPTETDRVREIDYHHEQEHLFYSTDVMSHFFIWCVVVFIAVVVYVASWVNMYRPPQVIRNVLTDDEIEYIQMMSTDKMTESKMVGSDSPDTTRRKSNQCWLTDERIRDMSRKVGRLVNRNPHKSEDLQVVKYGVTDFYKPHHDTCCFEKCKDPAANKRLKTVIVYLNDDFEGGETHFPNLNLKFKPRKGDAVAFDTYNLLGQCDTRALHEGLPVTRGVKNICTFWFHK